MPLPSLSVKRLYSKTTNASNTTLLSAATSTERLKIHGLTVSSSADGEVLVYFNTSAAANILFGQTVLAGQPHTVMFREDEYAELGSALGGAVKATAPVGNLYVTLYYTTTDSGV